MPVPGFLRRATGVGLRVTGALAFLAPLLTRLMLAHAFYQTGHGKLEHPEGVTRFFEGLGIPFPGLNAAFVSRLEYYGAILLLLGLLTRLVAAGLATTMIVALLTADREAFLDALWGRGQGDITSVAPVVLLVPLVWLVLYGPGPVSLDRFVRKWSAEGSGSEAN